MEEPSPISIAFGAVLRRQRERVEQSQASLAELAEIHPNYVSLLERGLRVPSLEIVLRLGTALSIGATKLVALVEEELAAGKG